MYTQNTPVHVNLWHKDFWLLALSNMLLSFSVYMFIPVIPFFIKSLGLSSFYMPAMTGAYCLGLFSSGSFASYLVQHRQRNNVCVLFVLLMAVCFSATYYLQKYYNMHADWALSAIVVLCFVFGGVYSMAHIILASTLIVDKCESFLRTEANHSAAWFFRFSLSLGPVLSVFLYGRYGVGAILLTAVTCCCLALLFIKIVDFPFKAPEDSVNILSTDRFFLPQGIWLFINQAIIMLSVGLILSLNAGISFYCILMLGFFLALLAQKFVFVNAELRSEILTGLFFIACALLLILCRRGGPDDCLVPVFTGFGIGITGARFLLFFLKLGNHCQRGTSQSTFFLSWESGLAAGLTAGYALQYIGKEGLTCYISLVLITLSFLMYQFFTHIWYMRHKNR